MDRSARVAVVGARADALAESLRKLPLRPEVRCFVAVCEAGEDLGRFRPDVVFADASRESPEEVGALRVLRQLWPELALVLLSPAEGELRHAALASRLDAQLLVVPCAPGRLAAALEHALQRSDRPQHETFVDLAHGIADEVNNPLMFVSGHLQLLRADLDPLQAKSQREQLDAALQGVERITAVVERLRTISTATAGPQRRTDVDLVPLLQRAMGARRLVAEQAEIDLPSGPCHVHGDQDQLAAAMLAAVEFADGLARGGSRVVVRLRKHDHALSLTLQAAGPGLADWRLPQSFEPYYPHRLLQGYGHGLQLFLLQAVVLGHRGQAVARRTDRDAIAIECALPTLD